MNSDSVPIVTLCGFLGSGKTTLLRRWRRDATLKDAPVIVHDLSEFGLDAELLSDENSKPSPGHLVGGVAALHGRHAREQLHDSAGEALEEISALDPAPPLVLCESTGAARPWPLIKALTQDKRFFLRHFLGRRPSHWIHSIDPSPHLMARPRGHAGVCSGECCHTLLFLARTALGQSRRCSQWSEVLVFVP